MTNTPTTEVTAVYHRQFDTTDPMYAAEPTNEQGVILPDTDTPQLTDKQLTKLHTRLWQLREMIDAAQERHESTPLGHLADSDADIVLLAARIVHRLMLDLRYAHRAETSYLAKPVEAERT